MRAGVVLGRALKVFGAVLLVLAAFVACYLFQPDKPGGWQVIADPVRFKMEISAYLAIPVAIGVVAIFFGFRLGRKDS